MVGDMVVAAHLDDLLFVERARFHRARREAGSAGQNMVGSTFRDTCRRQCHRRNRRPVRLPHSAIPTDQGVHRRRGVPPGRPGDHVYQLEPGDRLRTVRAA